MNPVLGCAGAQWLCPGLRGTEDWVRHSPGYTASGAVLVLEVMKISRQLRTTLSLWRACLLGLPVTFDEDDSLQYVGAVAPSADVALVT